MTIQSKFSIGDTIWSIHITYACDFAPCPGCNSSGSITLAGEIFACPKCHGTRRVYARQAPQWMIEKQFTINCILVYRVCGPEAPDGYRIWYSDNWDGDDASGHYAENRCFATEAEAQMTCDKLNSDSADIRQGTNAES